jgi:hypothetical protein
MGTLSDVFWTVLFETDRGVYVPHPADIHIAGE